MKVIPFGTLPDGRGVNAYSLSAGKYEVIISEYGAAVTSFSIDGTDVILGFDDVTGYVNHGEYMGAVVGRFANRIADGRFDIDGTEYQLPKNSGPNHLHGGLQGFDKKLWTAYAMGDKLRMEYVSEDMEEGYPGKLEAAAEFSLSKDGELTIHLFAETDKPTVLNLTNHLYFNLDGAACGHDVLEQRVRIPAEYFAAVDENCLPTGEIIPVKGTVFELDGNRKIGDMYPYNDEQIKLANGYDHSFTAVGNGFRIVAEAVSSSGDIKLTCKSDQPVVHLYTGNYIPDDRVGKGGAKYGKNYGFALEAQNFPNAPNNPNVPSAVLRPGEIYHHVTSFRLEKQV